MGNGAVRGRTAHVVPADPLDVTQLVASTRALAPEARDAGRAARAPSGEVPDGAPSGEVPDGAPACPAAGAGECLLLLERAHHVSGQLSVRATAERADGTLVGQVAEWRAKHCRGVPSWFSARPLGPCDAPTAALRIELWDRRRLLGSFSAPLQSLPTKSRINGSLDVPTNGEAGPRSVSFQLLDSQTALGPRVVFFVRHGESVWNKAQQRMHLHTLVQGTDHPLSVAGRDQAETLAAQLAAAKLESTEPAVAPMLLPDAVYSSPLTRALQTAVIALGPILAAPQGPGELVLMANARERQNRGGRDTRSTKLGAAILQGALDETRKLYQGRDSRVLEDFAQLRYDVEEVRECWWCESAKESELQLNARLDEFMAQLLYSPHGTAVVVGHSHFFREIFRRFLSPAFCAREPGLAEGLRRGKVANCGVVRLDLDPRAGLAGGPVLAARPVLGTRLLGPGRRRARPAPAPAPAAPGPAPAPAPAAGGGGGA